jgi:hypothetical protein
MERRRSPARAATMVGVLLGAAALGGCASDGPYAAPQQQPQRSLPRAPVVAPSGPASPWWWPLGESLWPF